MKRAAECFKAGGIFLNIYDIAKKAGVSTATVSRVLNNNPNVSPKTYEKVKRVVEESNFLPNQIAVGLATSTTRTVGIMVPDVRDSFHAQVAYLIENEMMQREYNCILCNTTAAEEKKIAYLSTLIKKNVDAIFLVGSSYNDRLLEELYAAAGREIPLVYINAVGAKGTCSIMCDDRYGLIEALEHLKARGKRHPVFIRDEQPYQTYVSGKREQAFLEGMEKVFGENSGRKTFGFVPTVENYTAFLKKIRAQGFEADSFMFTNDKCSAVFLKAMRQMGLKAPEDYALIGFNNSELTDLTSPAITTIDHRIEEHCSAAVKKLFALIADEPVEPVTYIQPKLVIKETT